MSDLVTWSASDRTFPPPRGGVDIVVVAARSFGMLVGRNDNDGTGHRYLHVM